MRMVRFRPGFTLIELVVAIIVLAVLAGVILPRALSTGERRARAEAQEVAALIGAAARKAALTAQPLALDYEGGMLRAMTLKARDPESFGAGNLNWAPESLLPVVRLAQLRYVSATRDGSTLDSRGWRVELGGETRPELLVNLEDDGGRVWSILLLPDAEGALLMDERQLSGGAGQVVDLDRMGRGLAAW